MTLEPFKRCAKCGRIWATREEFIADPEIVPYAYQPNFRDRDKGFYYFNHILGGGLAEDCHSTLAVEAQKFYDLCPAPAFDESKFATATCRGLCLQAGALVTCDQPCRYAYPREVLKRLIELKAQAAACA